jgi:uncharacterized protein YbjT (DUF2867 family)
MTIPHPYAGSRMMQYAAHMRAILFGATGMVGQGVLRECLQDSRVDHLLLVVRHATGSISPKLTELVHENFFDWTSIQNQFSGFDTCFFCVGVSAVGMNEADYRRITHDLTLHAADALLHQGVTTFIYVSGQGTNEHSHAMWARVKGATESALLQLPFAQTFCFRPGFIQPLHGIRSKTRWYNTLYTAVGFAYPLLKRLAKRSMTTTEEVGRAMISVAADGYPKQILETADIAAAAHRS